MKKISIIGAGNVGATTALFVAQKELADEIVLVDVLPGLAEGKALDMAQAGAIERFETKLTGTSDYSKIHNSQLVIITAGLTRKPGMSREDLLHQNASIIEEITLNIVKYTPEAIIIVVTNPVDVMTYHVWKVSGFPAQMVLGQAGVLDTARFCYFIAQELKVSAKAISAIILGGHGDSMVPLPRYATVSGIPLTELMDEATINRLSLRAQKGGGEIVELLKTGSAFYTPASATVQMAESILKDKKQILPCSVYLEGQYGISNIYIGVPVKLGINGVEEIIELNLTESELSQLHASAKIYKQNIFSLTMDRR
ncbi:MAG: malate dehydrogenase [bacterium]|nr:malate dehydrogenase [bacterium]